VQKRSLSIAGHRTSIALEPEFWAVLEQMATQNGQSLAGLVKSVDETRQTTNLSSALRLAALAWLQARTPAAD
jgi:predicted DNA-binding ribbon-helix-helix protein